jgi:light-regulated signal transduction histidine kinase (bacteriophytochrome)
VKLTRLIDDLLTFSRAGRGVLNKIPIALERMIAEIVDDLTPEIGGRRVEWIIGSLPVVYGDRNLMRQVFFNLIENAVKYTRLREEARIEISCVEDATDVIIVVRDNGAGFDMQYAHKLFGVFQRLHGAEEFEGTGIGLANVARIVQRHGGRVWAEGAKGRGAAFFVALPSRGVASE